MGADIHFVIEMNKREYDGAKGEYVFGEGWVGVYATYLSPMMFSRNSLPRQREDGKLNERYYFDRWPALKNRNYDFFARLAGVRGDGPAPKGFPPDASELALYCTDPAVDNDDHSHSWDTLENFVRLWLVSNDHKEGAQAVAQAVNGDDNTIIEYYAGIDAGDLKFYRVLYWFDN